MSVCHREDIIKSGKNNEDHYELQECCSSGVNENNDGSSLVHILQ